MPDRKLDATSTDSHVPDADSGAGNEWTTQGKIIEAEPGRAFAFECSMYGVHYSTSAYRIEPIRGGCRVTEWTEDLKA